MASEGPLRLLHTADWQIGKGFAFVGGDTAALLRERRIEMLADLARLARAEAVDVVLVAGDVFDAQTVADRTLLRACEQLEAFPVPVVLLPGNHDAARAESVWSRIEALGALPEHCIAALAPEPVPVAGGRAVVFPAPLRRRREPEDLTAWFDEAESTPGVLRIGLAHGTVTRRLPAEAERHNPLAEDRAATARLDYLALGDWHGTVEIAPRSWYAGTPEPDGFRGNASGQALIVELPGVGAQPVVRPVATGRYRFERLAATLDGHADLDALEARLEDLPSTGDTLLRLVLTGSLTLEGHTGLDALLARWDARLRELEVDRTALVAAATEEELAAFARDGFVGEAARRLLALAASADAETAATARDALQLLYAEHGALRRESS